ncbi:hypothetical protein SAMN06265222_10513 [Neorhodopirellula lusitana]|uniref:Secreted protein n=2 Tax=Neorhodopirellula lusitana TaxID=445327 RepID=A0ABY1Q182_9BACT|nr:hypothetical protein SAMN06265222_10513 [Neorhodopirellula lusitana]
MQLRLFVLGLGAVLFVAGCSEGPSLVTEDAQAIKDYEAQREEMKARLDEELTASGLADEG